MAKPSTGRNRKRSLTNDHVRNGISCRNGRLSAQKLTTPNAAIDGPRSIRRMANAPAASMATANT